MEHLLQLITRFSDYAKTNPVMAAACGLYVAGLTTFVFRKIPTKLWRFIVAQCTTSLTLTNTGNGRAAENFDAFSTWFQKRQGASMARRFMLDGSWSGDKDGATLSVGNGATNFFWWRKRLFWMRRMRLDNNQGAYQLNYEITVTLLGRSRKLIEDMVEEFRWRPNGKSIAIYTFNKNEWIRMARVGLRPLHTVVMNRSLKDSLIKNIEFYRSNRDWYVERGLAHKKTFILHGIPGTGKTSIIKAIASHYGMNLCVINLGVISDATFEAAMASVPANSIVVIEDFDSAKSAHRRRGAQPVDPQAPKSVKVSESGQLTVAYSTIDEPTPSPAPAEENKEDEFSMLTLSGILNTLDGVISLDEKLVFMTTNHLDLMDPALIRKGRVDHIYEVKPLEHDEVTQYVELMFPDTVVSINDHFAPILGCDLQALYFEYPESVEDFIEAIPKQARQAIKAVA